MARRVAGPAAMRLAVMSPSPHSRRRTSLPRAGSGRRRAPWAATAECRRWDRRDIDRNARRHGLPRASSSRTRRAVAALASPAATGFGGSGTMTILGDAAIGEVYVGAIGTGAPPIGRAASAARARAATLHSCRWRSDRFCHRHRVATGGNGADTGGNAHWRRRLYERPGTMGLRRNVEFDSSLTRPAAMAGARRRRGRRFATLTATGGIDTANTDISPAAPAATAGWLAELAATAVTVPAVMPRSIW